MQTSVQALIIAGCRGPRQARHHEVLVLEREQARDVLIADLVALGTELGDGGVDVRRYT
ncbi:hypothetical protein ABT127_20855 [Streptomyces sp. NPDC001904]|uniref:hypothetical protein n=1 Tax=Streptomyces sp. NPDC001904 TaxID=3154531 RepID=UPI00331AE48C